MSKGLKKKGKADEEKDLPLEEEFKFKLVPSEKSEGVTFIEFEDGRRYKFQEPSFMELHEELMSSKSTLTGLLRIGMDNIHPTNEQSEEITEAYLQKNKHEGFALWPHLFGRLLLHGEEREPVSGSEVQS